MFERALLVVAAVAASACGGRTFATSTDAGQTTGDAGAPTSPEAGCAAQSVAECTLRDTCSGGIGTQVDYGSASECASLLTESCLAAFDAPGTATTLAHVDGCAAVYGSQTCTQWADDDVPQACHSAIGSRADGAVCAESSQCSSGFCFVAENAACGTCQATPKVGDPCEIDSNCGYDLACSFYVPATSGVCTAWGATSASCDRTHPCQGGLACVGSNNTLGIQGTCQTAATTGAACDNATGPACDGSLYLECVSGTCQVEPLVGAGSPCGQQSSGLFNRCTGGAACVTSLGPCQHGTGASCGDATGGVCATPAANGSACDLVKGPLCLSPAKCIVMSDGGTSGTCVSPDPASCG